MVCSLVRRGVGIKNYKLKAMLRGWLFWLIGCCLNDGLSGLKDCMDLKKGRGFEREEK